MKSLVIETVQWYELRNELKESQKHSRVALRSSHECMEEGKKPRIKMQNWKVFLREGAAHIPMKMVPGSLA